MDVLAWLLGSDPAIRWQVMRDLTEAPEDLVAAERARVAARAGAHGCSHSSSRTASGLPPPRPSPPMTRKRGGTR